MKLRLCKFSRRKLNESEQGQQLLPLVDQAVVMINEMGAAHCDIKLGYVELDGEGEVVDSEEECLVPEIIIRVRKARDA